MLTNEERRIYIYSGEDAPTDAVKVTPETPLADLNLNWREKDLPEKLRTKHVHRLHPYLGKYIPQLVEIFLRKYFKPGQTVLDPFSGSATTLVQANELGINAVGCDISAFNVMLGNVKTANYDLALLKKEILDILEKTSNASKRHKASGQIPLWEDHTTIYTEIDNEYLRSWFAPNALKELLAYRNFILSEGYKYQDLLKIILSRSARSARLTPHFDLDFPKKPQTEPYYCYKHSRTCEPTTEAFKFIKRYSLDTLKRVEEYSTLRTDASTLLIHGDSRNVKFPSVNGVITSPPYVGLIDYHEQHAYAYHLLGLDDNRDLEIGPAINGSSKKAKTTYQDDIVTVFHNALLAMPTDGYLIVVAGDKANLYEDIANNLDVHVEAIVQRHVNRRTGRRSSDFFESVFIWRKK
jgi:hypothetical protein